MGASEVPQPLVVACNPFANRVLERKARLFRERLREWEDMLGHPSLLHSSWLEHE